MEFTIILLVLLAFISGVTLTYGILKHRENQALKCRIQELMLHLRRYERLLESMKETERQKDEDINIDMRILELYNKGYSLRRCLLYTSPSPRDRG